MPVLWEYTDETVQHDWLGQSWTRTITIRTGEEVWTIVEEAEGEDRRLAVSGPEGERFRPRLRDVSLDDLALAVIRHLAHRDGDQETEAQLAALARALEDPTTPGRATLVRRLLQSGQARVRRGEKT